MSLGQDKPAPMEPKQPRKKMNDLLIGLENDMSALKDSIMNKALDIMNLSSSAQNVGELLLSYCKKDETQFAQVVRNLCEKLKTVANEE